MNAWEQTACRFLETQGLRLLQGNFRCRGGEIDLVMRDREEIAMVEVRQRRQGRQGGAAASVDTRKQRRLVVAARAWQAAHPELADTPLRFDVLAFEGDRQDWIRDAFRCD